MLPFRWQLFISISTPLTFLRLDRVFMTYCYSLYIYQSNTAYVSQTDCGIVFFFFTCVFGFSQKQRDRLCWASDSVAVSLWWMAASGPFPTLMETTMVCKSTSTYLAHRAMTAQLAKWLVITVKYCIYKYLFFFASSVVLERKTLDFFFISLDFRLIYAF